MDKGIGKTSKKNAGSYVAGIGASAGGLDAINELFDNIPATTGFSFVIIQHLSPHHKSLMAELLSRHTEMPVIEAQEGMQLQANCIYLIPPGKIITLKNNLLLLEEKIRDNQPNTAIDIFFESLAREKKDRAIGIILSGSGTDGTRGIQAIKNNGGTVVVQDPATAAFSGMPNSAIGTGCADLILSPDMIPEELLEYLQESPLIRSFNTLSEEEETVRQDILELVLKVTGHDFSAYKRPTINRRMAKRMAEKNLKNLSDYYNYLVSHPAEVRKLCREFLLHVTRFFRDETAFNTIKTKVLPKIFGKKEKDDVIKVWTVACSTGEEAYSLAILFEEYMEESNQYGKEVKIFATDLSQEVINIASRGLYTEEQVKGVSPTRLKRYFSKEADGYRVVSSVRKMIVFARHDVIKDPPFSKIDLLTCRNMMIYMNQELQKSILQKFHFALNENGCLLLGPSEHIGILKEVMQEVDRKWKIYTCISKTRLSDIESFPNPGPRSFMAAQVTTSKPKNALNHVAEIFRETLLEEYDYAGIFLDRNLEVKQAMGNFRKFLELPEEHFNLNVLKLVPPELAVVLSTLLRKAIKDNERVVQRHVKAVGDAGQRSITVIVKPYLASKKYNQPFIFVILKEEELEKKLVSVALNPEEYATGRVRELENELRETRENLQALIEEVESANEELQSSNEEIISSNEELQSTNEELQSLNEELHTVNAEHQMKIKELIELNDDLNNHFLNTDIGQILVDRELTIRKFTPAATRLVNLIPNDVGRSIADISVNIQSIDLVGDIKRVISSGGKLEREVAMEDEKTYLMRIVPYLRQNNVPEGVVVNFVDVSEIKNLTNLLAAVFNSSASGIIAMRAVRNEQRVITDFEIISANKTSLELSSLPQNVVGRKYRELYTQVDPVIFDKYVHVVESGRTVGFEFYNARINKWYDIVGVKMMDGLVVTFSDISERKMAAATISRSYGELEELLERLRITNRKLEDSNFDLLQFASVASHDLKEPLRKVQVFGNMLMELATDKIGEQERSYLEKIIKTSGRMRVMIDDILTLSRLSNNEAPKVMIDLNELVTQIIDDLAISIREKGATVHKSALPVVNGVPGQLRQLFQNILSNAIKFNEGTPLIEIGSDPATPELEAELGIRAADYHVLYIQDNGIGFDERFRERIFGIFQRLEKTNYPGTGIGLAIAKKIVDNHHGFIKASGDPGKGARFVILLPKSDQY